MAGFQPPTNGRFWALTEDVPAVLVVDTLAVCSDHCGWSCIVSRQHRRGAGMWYEHLSPGRGWGRRWCSAQEVS